MEDGIASAPGNVHEGLIHYDQATGTQQSQDRRTRMQTRGRVGRVSHNNQISICRDQRRIQGKTVLLVQDQASHDMPACPQGGLRLGELRVHHQRFAPASRPGDQREGLRCAVRDQQAGRRGSVQPGQCAHRGGDVRISGHVIERALELTAQPRRRPGHSDVHREIDQTGLDLAIAVMTEVDRGHPRAPIRPRRFQNTRAPTQVTAKIAAMP